MVGLPGGQSAFTFTMFQAPGSSDELFESQHASLVREFENIEREFGYAAIGVGLLIGFAASKVGGSNPVIPVVSAVLSLGAVFLGQVICISMILADAAHVGFSELFFDHFSVAVDAWKEEAHFMTYVFLALGPVAAFGGAKRAE